MAEIVAKIRAGSGYDDGDCLCAFNSRHISHCHAQHLCNVKHAGFTSEGLRPIDSLAHDYNQTIYQYKFERVSKTEVQRINLETNEVEIFGKPDIDVELYVSRRLKHERHLVFGSPGSEIWYGGTSKSDIVTVNLVWDKIENRSNNRRNEAKFQKYPAGMQELKSHLFLAVEDFDDETANSLVESEYAQPDRDGNRELLQKRIITIPWRDIVTNVDTVLDRSIVVDERDIIRTRETITVEKTRVREESEEPIRER